VAVGNDSQFAKFCEVIGAPEWARDPRFDTNPRRVRHRDLLVAMIADRLRAQPAREWLRRLEPAGVPCGPINNLDQVFDDPQVRHRELRVAVAHAAGEVTLVANPIKFSATPIAYDRAPPLLGEHTGEVLHSVLGLDTAEIERLHATGVL
jgi:formyl-CoA transferase